jgi:hypothetical protein
MPRYQARRESLLADGAKLQALYEAAKIPVAPDPSQVDDWLLSWTWDPAWEPAKKRQWLLDHGVSATVSRRGITNLVVRLPARDGGTVPVSVAVDLGY